MIGWSDPALARQLAAVSACIGMVVSSLEWLLPPSKLAAYGLLAPGPFGPPARDAGALPRWWRPTGIRCLLAARLLLALGFIVASAFACSELALGVMLSLAGGACLPLRFREPLGVPVGMDGSEHQLALVLLVLGPTFLLDSAFSLRLALAFVAFQALLEYVSAGWTKLADLSGWARGEHLARVVASSNYGHPALARHLLAKPYLSGALSLGVIALELSAPCALLAPAPWAELLLAGLICFHLCSGLVMGLSTFVWAFAASYPAILFFRDMLGAL